MTEYNSPENYADLFADILADIDADDPSYGDNIVKGFFLALEDWLAYHQYRSEEPRLNSSHTVISYAVFCLKKKKNHKKKNITTLN